MTEIVLHEDAFEELRGAFISQGVLPDDNDTLYADQFTVNDITFKLWKYAPTPEEIERNRLFAESPMGKFCIEVFKRTNEKFVKSLVDRPEDFLFAQGKQWDGANIGTTLRIRLPNDYSVKDA